jgi:multicomponent Na+:H+ antiporter subunit E
MILRAIILRAALFSALWWMLTGGEHGAWGVGLATIVLAVTVSLLLRPPSANSFSITRFPNFFVFFLLKSIQSGIQVAGMTLRPRLDLQPAMLEIQLRLPEEAPRIFLASILNLLPGSLSAGLDGNRLYLHVLDQRMPIEQEVRNVETRVARLFRTELI